MPGLARAFGSPILEDSGAGKISVVWRCAQSCPYMELDVLGNDLRHSYISLTYRRVPVPTTSFAPLEINLVVFQALLTLAPQVARSQRVCAIESPGLREGLVAESAGALLPFTPRKCFQQGVKSVMFSKVTSRDVGMF